jgi:HK97 family phage prohead protease
MRQYKDFDSTIKDVDEKGRVLVAANAIGNEDADKDISMDGSFDKTLKENFNRLKWFLNHNTTLLLGVPVEGKQAGQKLEMLGQLNLKKELSRDTYEDYKLYAEYGRTLEHSVGVEAIKKEQKDGIRRVFEWKLWEYSTLTSWGANDQTEMLGIKNLSDAGELITWFELKLKKGNFTDERFMQIESQLNILRSLCTEPEASTLKAKPTDDELKKTLSNFLTTW